MPRSKALVAAVFGSPKLIALVQRRPAELPPEPTALVKKACASLCTGHVFLTGVGAHGNKVAGRRGIDAVKVQFWAKQRLAP
jgi:hypothetical protein